MELQALVLLADIQLSIIVQSTLKLTTSVIQLIIKRWYGILYPIIYFLT